MKKLLLLLNSNYLKLKKLVNEHDALDENRYLNIDTIVETLHLLKDQGMIDRELEDRLPHQSGTRKTGRRSFFGVLTNTKKWLKRNNPEMMKDHKYYKQLLKNINKYNETENKLEKKALAVAETLVKLHDKDLIDWWKLREKVRTCKESRYIYESGMARELVGDAKEWIKRDKDFSLQ